jgi:hypothetical protein
MFKFFAHVRLLDLEFWIQRVGPISAIRETAIGQLYPAMQIRTNPEYS